MYQVQDGKISVRELRFPEAGRAITSFFLKIHSVLQESREKEARQITAQSRNGRAFLFSKFG